MSAILKRADLTETQTRTPLGYNDNSSALASLHFPSFRVQQPSSVKVGTDITWPQPAQEPYIDF
jgi:hypothetical protein